MPTATFLFLDCLNDFLPRDHKDQNIEVAFRGRQSLKHLAESLGVPHPEIGRVEVNGVDGGLSAITRDGDRVILHPLPDGPPFEPPRFLLDCHLGRLTSHLRMLGFDCLYRNDYTDNEIAASLESDRRILLTRDRRLLMRKSVRYGYCLRSLDSRQQLLEVVGRFELAERVTPFHRCLRCNHPLEPVEKSAVIDRLEPLTKRYFDEFHLCPACGQIYWKGSHYEQMTKLLEEIRG
ncbi:MAG: Mut7-C RNAse domain-containing protein [Chloroflexota bacterium]